MVKSGFQLNVYFSTGRRSLIIKILSTHVIPLFLWSDLIWWNPGYCRTFIKFFIFRGL